MVKKVFEFEVTENNFGEPWSDRKFQLRKRDKKVEVKDIFYMNNVLSTGSNVETLTHAQYRQIIDFYGGVHTMFVNPKTPKNFVQYLFVNYYDEISFHEITNFMVVIQIMSKLFGSSTKRTVLCPKRLNVLDKLGEVEWWNDLDVFFEKGNVESHRKEMFNIFLLSNYNWVTLFNNYSFVLTENEALDLIKDKMVETNYDDMIVDFAFSKYWDFLTFSKLNILESLPDNVLLERYNKMDVNTDNVLHIFATLLVREKCSQSTIFGMPLEWVDQISQKDITSFCEKYSFARKIPNTNVYENVKQIFCHKEIKNSSKLKTVL